MLPLVVAFVLGACVGSFLNVCIHRIPADESVVSPGSRCPACATPIAWYDNVPLLSWLALGARCRACRARISARYPFVEAASGALAVLAVAAFGPTPKAVVAFAYTAALLLVTFIDLDHQFIPDEVSLPGIAVGLGVSFLGERFAWVSPLDSFAGALAGAGILALVAWGYERLVGIEGMGWGDVKLLGMIGAFVGWEALPMGLVVASVVGSFAGFAVIASSGAGPVGRRVRERLGVGALASYARRAARRTAIPFGPFLALGGFLPIYLPGFLHPWT